MTLVDRILAVLGVMALGLVVGLGIGLWRKARELSRRRAIQRAMQQEFDDLAASAIRDRWRAIQQYRDQRRERTGNPEAEAIAEEWQQREMEPEIRNKGQRSER